MFNSIGIPELALVLLIVLVIFGPKRLPGLGRSLGAGMREFKDSISGKSKPDEDEDPEPARGEQRAQVEEALGRPEGEATPLEGEVVSDRQ